MEASGSSWESANSRANRLCLLSVFPGLNCTLLLESECSSLCCRLPQMSPVVCALIVLSEAYRCKPLSLCCVLSARCTAVFLSYVESQPLVFHGFTVLGMKVSV